MLPYKPIPMFKLGPLHFNMYGLMFAAGVLVANFFARKEAAGKGLSPSIIDKLFIYLLIGIIVGARLFYVLFYWPRDVPLTFFDIFKVWEGGLAFFGGFIGALLVGYIFARKNSLDFWKLADIFTYPLIIGHILGRIGGFLTGQHPGRLTEVPWGINIYGALRHPVVLYEITGLLIILSIILILKRYDWEKGVLFNTYLFLYSVQRLFLDIFRIEGTDPRTFGLTPTQILVIFLGLFALGFVFKKILVNKQPVKDRAGMKTVSEKK